jgi:mono/diheme cytochrome c family protein
VIGRRSWPALTGLVLLAPLWQAALAYEPAVNYMLQCMGCHAPKGEGEPGRVPSLRTTLVPFASVAEGRRFIVQVPGAAQSTLSDAELADLLNWMIHTLSTTPLVNVRATRERLLARLSASRGGSVPTHTAPPPTPAGE